jgi:hypothetical protein
MTAQDQDSDKDGTSDLEENKAPNGDGNGDGIADKSQANVTTLDTAVGDSLVTVVFDPSYECPVPTTLNTLSNINDVNYNFANGLIEFKINCEKVKVTTIWHGIDSISDFKYRKYGNKTPGDNSTLDYYDLNAELKLIKINDKNVLSATYEYEDNKTGDNTGDDGVIVDPIGPARPKPLVSSTSSAYSSSLSLNNSSKLSASNLIRTGSQAIPLIIPLSLVCAYLFCMAYTRRNNRKKTTSDHL